MFFLKGREECLLGRLKNSRSNRSGYAVAGIDGGRGPAESARDRSALVISVGRLKSRSAMPRRPIGALMI
jgi:hypothetical protein